MEDPSFARLSTPRLGIRRLGPADAEAFAAYRSDPDVARHQDWDCPFPIDAARAFIAGQNGLAPGTPGRWFQFAVTLASSPTLIGDIGLHVGEDDGPAGEVGFTFAAGAQGHGYATEALRAILHYAFAVLRLRRVCARTAASNVRAQRLLERTGFERAGETAEDVLYVRRAGDPLDRVAAESGPMR